MKGIQYRFKMLVALSLLMVCFAPMGFAPKRAFAADAAQQELKVLRSMVEALALSVAAASEDNAALRREVTELRREVAALRAGAGGSASTANVTPDSPKDQGTLRKKENKEEDGEMNALLKSFLKQVLSHAVETLELSEAQPKEKSEKR